MTGTAQLIAQTGLTLEGILAMEEIGYAFHDNEDWSDPSKDITEPDEIGEFAGRLCYESWSRPNPKTSTNRGYLENIIEHKHFSTLEHSSVTFLFRGVSRSLTHELVRHRHFSYSQVSQRYVDQYYRKFVGHPLFDELGDWTKADIQYVTQQNHELYLQIQEELRRKGFTKKEANGAARQVLPEGTETAILVTGNLRSWREAIDKRYSEFADQEIRDLAELILPSLKKVAPNSFQDMELKDFMKHGGVQN